MLTLQTFFIVLLLLNLTTATPPAAIAIFQEQDGIWGSIIFRQHIIGTVSIFGLIHNVKTKASIAIHWNVHQLAVNYNKFDPEQRCKPDALSSLLARGQVQRRLDTTLTIETTIRHSLQNMLDRSFVLDLGDNLYCDTIVPTYRLVMPGTVPCELAKYPDCLVGTSRPNVCVFRSCTGYRRVWGAVSQTTQVCEQYFEKYPTASGSVAFRGAIECTHGLHSLLRPVPSS